MWKKLEISDEKFFMNCALTDDEKMICVLFSRNKCWFATLTDDEIKQKVELLNNRMEYNKFVKNTLLNGDLAQASIEELAQTSISGGVNKRLLKLKYRIEELPFKFEWSLTQACTEEFQRNFFVPLLLAVDGYRQQVQELKSIIHKKDEEIKEYRGEGFTLRRTTAITRPFDADEFNNKRKDHKYLK
uniref:Non-homologous end-joining factor 1 n=1 Tax=Glossina austeni TaxID=7395 RepID=A0A1A9VLP0_GLOAU